MNILVLGSQGFIGSHVANYFQSKDHCVTGCDLVENRNGRHEYKKISILSADFDAMFSSKSFDVCINASGSGNVAYSIEHPSADFEANAMAVAKVLDTLRRYNPTCRYLHLSSAAVYGNPLQLPIRETDALSPLSPYGYHKWISEIICREYYQLYHLPIAVIRPFSVYGKGLRKQLLWDICSKLKTADSICLFGTGDESRDFIEVRDLCLLIGGILEKADFKFNIINAASGIETRIRDLAQLFERASGGRKQISFTGNARTGDPLNWRADVTQAKLTGFIPSVSLQQGVHDYINWFESL